MYISTDMCTGRKKQHKHENTIITSPLNTLLLVGSYQHRLNILLSTNCCVLCWALSIFTVHNTIHDYIAYGRNMVYIVIDRSAPYVYIYLPVVTADSTVHCVLFHKSNDRSVEHIHVLYSYVYMCGVIYYIKDHPNENNITRARVQSKILPKGRLYAMSPTTTGLYFIIQTYYVYYPDI
jgi:hypothetical protein